MGIKTKFNPIFTMPLVIVAIITFFSIPNGIITILIKKFAVIAGINETAKIAKEEVAFRYSSPENSSIKLFLIINRPVAHGIITNIVTVRILLYRL